MECPVCDGELVRRKVPYIVGEVNIGTFEADVCAACDEVFFTEASSDDIDMKAKEIGIWGLEKKGKIGYSGNSLIVRIPKKVAEFMGLEKGEGITIKPQDKKHLIIEIE